MSNRWSLPASKLAVVVAMTTGIVGCGIIYRQPIYQGSLVDPASIEQLQVGMSKQQVASMLGSPTIADPFHQDRWDYTSSQRRGRSGKTEVRNFVVYFDGDNLARWEGDYFPNEDGEIAARANKEFGYNLRKDNKRR